MLSFLSPKLWLVAGLSILLACAFAWDGAYFYRAGKRVVQVQLLKAQKEAADYKTSVSETTRLLQAANDRQALAQLTKVKEAQDAAKVREDHLRADADGARKQLDRLRVALKRALAAGSNPVPGAAPDANAEPAATVGQLFLDCAAAYGELAEKAGRHASDVQTLTEAWPKQQP